MADATETPTAPTAPTTPPPSVSSEPSGASSAGRPPRPTSSGGGLPPFGPLHATRTTQLQALVEKRRMNLDYLRRAHTHHMMSSSGPSEGPSPIYWLNTVALDPERVRAHVETEVPKARPLLLFRLGLSLGKLLLLFDSSSSSTTATTQEPPPTPSLGETAAFVRALAQLFEELDFHYSNGAVQSMRLLLARPADGPYPEPRTRLAVGLPQPSSSSATAEAPTAAAAAQAGSPPPPAAAPPEATTTEAGDNDDNGTTTGGGNSGEPLAVALQPKLMRLGPDAAYEALYPIPPPPHPISYPLVVDSLAHVLGRAYALLGSPRHAPMVVGNPALFEAVVRVDAQVKHHVINPLAKGLTELATAEAKREIDWLRDTYLGGGGGMRAAGGGSGSGGGGGGVTV